MKTRKVSLIKKQTNNKVLFVKFILDNWQFKVMTASSRLHGIRWPSFTVYTKTMSLVAAVVKKMEF